MLPFDQSATVEKQGGEVVATDVGVSVWPAGDPGTTRTGETYDWTGEADSDEAQHLVRQTNRTLVVDNVRFKLIAAWKHDWVPHVELRLREVRSGG